MHKEIYAYYLCSGFIEAGDQARADQCIDVVQAKAATTLPKEYGQLASYIRSYKTQTEYLEIQYNQFLLEQGRFKEVNDKLMPYMKREGAMLYF